MTNDDEVKERFYQELDLLLLSVPTEDKLIVMGDFNARVGQDDGVWKGVIGKHGVRKENSNGTLLLSECAKHDLAITNTFFQVPVKKKTTWLHPRSKQWHLIYRIITRQKDLKDVHITKAMRGADCWTDHRLVRAQVSLTIHGLRRKSAPKLPRRLDTARLKDSVAQQLLASKIKNAALRF